jgi:hypothetical protein
MKSWAPKADGQDVTESTSNQTAAAAMSELELLVSEAYDEGAISEVIRPAAILPETNARGVLVELALRDVHNNGQWDGPGGGAGTSELIGSIQVAYGTPTRYEITIYRVTVTQLGREHGWTVETLCDEALTYGGLSLAGCPRATMTPPPQPFRFPEQRA